MCYNDTIVRNDNPFANIKLNRDQIFWLVVGAVLIVYAVVALDTLSFVATLVSLVVAITMHEFAHAWVADMLGDRAQEGPVNEVYAAVRGALRAMGLDAERFGTADWNPIGALVEPGRRIVIKPNLIRHWNPASDGRG